MIKVESFHPMLGHILDGQEIDCDNKKIIVIKNTIKGWILKDRDTNEQLFGPSNAVGIAWYIENRLT